MLLSLDISTSVIGLALFSEDDYKLHELSYLKFKKGTNLFDKLNEFIEHFEKYSKIEINELAVEAPLLKFRGKFSNALTIQKLTQMNAMISGYLYEKLKVEPVYYNVLAARSLAFPDLVIPQSHPNKKYLIWESTMKAFSHINWVYNKGGKLVDENFDMADAAVVGLAHIVTKIKQKQAQKATA